MKKNVKIQFFTTKWLHEYYSVNSWTNLGVISQNLNTVNTPTQKDPSVKNVYKFL